MPLASAVQVSPPSYISTAQAADPGARLTALTTSDPNWVFALAARDAQLAGRDLQLVNLLSTIAQRLATVWGSPQYNPTVDSFPVVGRNVYGQPYIPDSPQGQTQVNLPDYNIRPTTLVISGNGWRSRDDGFGKLPSNGPFLGGTVFYQTGSLILNFASAQTGMTASYVHDFWANFSNNDIPLEGPATSPFDPGYIDGTCYPIDAADTDRQLSERDRAIYSALGKWTSFLQRFNLDDTIDFPLISDFPMSQLVNPLQVDEVWSRADGIPQLVYPGPMSPWGYQDIVNADRGLAWRDNALASWAAGILNVWNNSARWLKLAQRIHIRKSAPNLISGIGSSSGVAIAASPTSVLSIQSSPQWDWETFGAMVTDSAGNFIVDSSGNAVFSWNRTSGVRWQDGRRPPETLHLSAITSKGFEWQSDTPGDNGTGISYDIVRHRVTVNSDYQDVQIAPEVAAMGFSGDPNKQQTVQLTTDIAPADDLTTLAIKAASVGNEGYLQLVQNGRIWSEALAGNVQDTLGTPAILNGGQFWGQNPCILQAGANVRLQTVLESVDNTPGAAYQFSILYKVSPTLTKPASQCDSTSSGYTSNSDGTVTLSSSATTNVPNSAANTPSLVWPIIVPAGQWSLTINTSSLPQGTRWSCWQNGSLIGSVAPEAGSTSISFPFSSPGGSNTILTNLDYGPAGISVSSLSITQVSCSLGQSQPVTFELYLETKSKGQVLSVPIGNSNLALTNRRGARLIAPSTYQPTNWLQAWWEASPSNSGYLTTEAGIPITDESGIPISIDSAPQLVQIDPEIIQTQSLPGRCDVYHSGCYLGSELYNEPYSIRVSWISNPITPIELVGWSVSKLLPGDPRFPQTQRAKSRFSSSAESIVAKGWQATCDSKVMATNLTDKSEAFLSSSMYNWLQDISVTLPNLSDSFRPSLPSDIGKPCIVPQSLINFTGSGATALYSRYGLTPKLVSLQPWHIELGTCVLKEQYWHVPKVDVREALLT